MYPAVTRVNEELQELMTSEELISPPHPQKTLFARQMKQYEATKPI